MKKFQVSLDARDWGQILDGLRCRLETYEETVRYYETGNAEGEIEEVRDVDEAESLAKTYSDLIQKIEKSLAAKSRC